MKTTFTKEPHSKIKLEVAISTQEFQEYWDRSYSLAQGEVHLKGFRPGTAPKELADKAINKEKVFDDAANEAVRATLQDVTDKEGWVLIDKPHIEVLEAHPFDSREIKKDEKTGLKYKADIVIFPEVNLEDYKKIAQTILKEKKEIIVEDKEVDDTLNWLQKSRAKLIRVTRTVKNGDVIEGDINAQADGKPIPNGALIGDRFVVGESKFISGFDEKLIDHKEGENVKFTLIAPTDYWQKDLQNKEITFTVVIKSVYERELPELNDAFATSLGPNFKTMDDVKKNIKEGVLHEKQEKQKQELRTKLLEEISKTAKIDPPEIMIEKVLDSLVLEAKQFIAQSGQQEEYTDEKLRSELKERARERVFAQLALHKLAQIEGLEPNKEEVQSFATAKNLDPEKNYDYSYGIVLQEKVFKFLENTKN